MRLLLTPPFQPRVKWALVGIGAVGLVAVSVLGYLWYSYGHQIDARLAGEQRPVPRIFGRPLELSPGQSLSQAQLVQRLNDLGYAQRAKAAAPGEFEVAAASVVIAPLAPETTSSRLLRADFGRATSPVLSRLSIVGGRAVDRVTLDAPLIAALAPGERRRYVPLASIPRHMIDAVLAIEDHRFYDHPGVDPIGALGAVWTNLRGNRPYLVGGSTITQQVIKNTLLTPAKTYRRKLQEQFMALVLESRFTKDQILELYLNDVVLGQRGPFEIRGVSEAARVFFAKDIRNVTLAEAATIAGIIQSPSRLSPSRNPDRARERRNVVLQQMQEFGVATEAEVERARKEPLVVWNRGFENEAPYFVDYVSKLVDEKYAGLLKKDAAVDVYTTLDLQLQRIAQEAVGAGLTQVDKMLAGRKRQGKAQAALVAVDPRTGEILAFVGGRSYTESQYNRVVAARRQPGSIFKPFVYLAAFEHAAAEGRSDVTPATVVVDEPTTFKDGDNEYTPGNFQGEYDGPTTLRHALAHSRNIVAIKVAEAAGYDQVANLWNRTKVGGDAKPYPSIALGVFEATPLEMAEAYTLFTNGGQVRPLRAVSRILENGSTRRIPPAAAREVARPDTTYLVVNMMRSVLNEGTGAGARSAGFTADAAGKTGTTNDLRDAWFIGFTPELLTAVWVGFDNNQPIGLGGAQAALPIWTAFMKRALAGREGPAFDVPPGVEFVSVDASTGQLATPACPKVIQEAFLAGTAPTKSCELHGEHGIAGFFSRLGALFGR
ncbi:MAG: PBP1A family penicillin-binding protein [Acidobacteria bacterium]|nr:PBP1A family penicillin-binding protein [Acidobacteriota bacterium]